MFTLPPGTRSYAGSMNVRLPLQAVSRRVHSIPVGAAALLLLAVLALTACSPRVAPEDGTPAAGTGSTSQPTVEQASVKVTPDADDDGVVDADDECPAAQEDSKWSKGTDGCPDTIDDLLSFAASDINNFWKNEFDSEGESYSQPRGVTGYSRTIRTGCGASVPDNAFYCSADNSIYYDADFLEGLLERYGDFSPVFVVAHEWGHLVQAQLGILQDRRRADIQNELQADCFAGVYTKNAEERGLLEEGDLDEGVTTALKAGDPAGTPWYESGAHGTSKQRTAAFQSGYDDGVDACMGI